MSATFQKDATVVSLPDPAPGSPARAVRRQAVGRTAGGTLYAYEKGAPTSEVELRFESLTDAERSALAGFFNTAAQGCRQSFTYTDSGGVAHTARFLDPTLDFVKVCANVWDVRLRLELTA